MFTYLKEAKDNEHWEGKAITRITPTARNLINLVDGDYGIHSKVKTTTSLFYIGIFNMLSSLNQDNYNMFLKVCTRLDRRKLLLPDAVGTDKHKKHHEMIFKLHYVSTAWHQVKKNTFTLDEYDNNLSMNYYSDNRFGSVFDMMVDRFGFKRIDIADLAIFYAINNCNLVTDEEEDHATANRISKLVQSNTITMNEAIETFLIENNIIN